MKLQDACQRLDGALGRLSAVSTRIEKSTERLPKTQDLAAYPLPSILVLEDEPDVAHAYQRLLGDLVHVRLARDSADALEICTGEAPPSLLLSDRVGKACVRALRERGSRLPVIVCSGWDPEPDWAPLVDAWVQKPPREGELEGLIGRLTTPKE